MDRKRVIEMYVNSYLDRIESENDSTSKTFTIDLDKKNKQIELMNGEKELKLRVFAVELPNVLYNFKENENRLWFDVGNLGTEQSIKFIEINTERVYSNPLQIIDEINTKLNAVITGLSLSYDDNTKKCELLNNTGQVVRLISSFRYASSETILSFNDMNDRLGFSDNYTNVVIPNNGRLVGNGHIRMNRTNRFHICLEQQSTYYNQSITPLANQNYRVVASVPTGSYGVLSTFSYVSSYSHSLQSQIKELRFSVRDDEFNLVDFKNHPITMALQFETY